MLIALEAFIRSEELLRNFGGKLPDECQRQAEKTVTHIRDIVNACQGMKRDGQNPLQIVRRKDQSLRALLLMHAARQGLTINDLRANRRRLLSGNSSSELRS